MELSFEPQRDGNVAGRRFAAQRITDVVLQFMPHAKSALDLGMGRGYLVEELRSMGLDAVGVDVRNLSQSHLILADARQLPFRDSSFDVVSQHLLLADMEAFQKMSTAECERVVREAYRVLRTGGIFISTPKPVSAAEFGTVLYKDQHWGGVYQK